MQYSSPSSFSNFQIFSFSNYSVLKLFTGFAIAAFIALKLIVINAINKAITPAMINIHQLIAVRYAKSSSHRLIAQPATGKAITEEIITSLRKSLDNIATILLTLAPNTFLMPISLIRCSAA